MASGTTATWTGTSSPSAGPPPGSVANIDSAVRGVLTEGTVVGAFIVVALALAWALVKCTGWLLYLQRARHVAVERHAQVLRLLEHAEQLKRAQEEERRRYENPIGSNLHLPGTVRFEDVMGLDDPEEGDGVLGIFNGPEPGAGGGGSGGGGPLLRRGAPSVGVPAGGGGAGRPGERRSFVSRRMTSVGMMARDNDVFTDVRIAGGARRETQDEGGSGSAQPGPGRSRPSHMPLGRGPLSSRGLYAGSSNAGGPLVSPAPAFGQAGALAVGPRSQVGASGSMRQLAVAAGSARPSLRRVPSARDSSQPSSGIIGQR